MPNPNSDFPVSRRLFALLFARRGLWVMAAEEDAGDVLVGLELFDEPRNRHLIQRLTSDQTDMKLLYYFLQLNNIFNEISLIWSLEWDLVIVVERQSAVLIVERQPEVQRRRSRGRRRLCEAHSGDNSADGGDLRGGGGGGVGAASGEEGGAAARRDQGAVHGGHGLSRLSLSPSQQRFCNRQRGRCLLG